MLGPFVTEITGIGHRFTFVLEKAAIVFALNVKPDNFGPVL